MKFEYFNFVQFIPFLLSLVDTVLRSQNAGHLSINVDILSFIKIE